MAGLHPIVAPDPTDGWVELNFWNPTAVPVGPIQFYGGRIIDDMTGKTLLTFAIKPTPDLTVQPGRSAWMRVEKATGSGKPANGCKSVPCNGMFRIVIDWAPPVGMPDHSSRSDPTGVICAF